MRKNGLLMISPLRTESKLEKMYEILPDGIEELEKIKTKGFKNADLVMQKITDRIKTIEILDQILELIQNDEKIDPQKKHLISSKLSQIRNKLTN
jgi:DNA-binding PadR family transcriptional regulator